MLSFIQSLLEPGSSGSAGEAQHFDLGLQQLHVPCQVPLHDQCHHPLHQQEQDQQPACVCGGSAQEVSQHQVSPAVKSLRGFTVLNMFLFFV